MSHNLAATQQAVLDTFGGLVTDANATDLAEGVSPRCYDVDFVVGSVFTRPGLSPVYTFSGNSIGPNNGEEAEDVASGGFAWSSPANALGSAGYASVTTSMGGSPTLLPGSNTTGASTAPWITAPSGTAWSNPQNAASLTLFASVTLTLPSTPTPPSPPPPTPPPTPPFGGGGGGGGTGGGARK